MEIPKRFKLLGHTVEVQYRPADFYENGRHGAASYEQKVIRLTSRSDAHPVTQSSLEHTFLHEVIHHCLYHTEQAALNGNENFVDLLAGLLHQVLTTMEHD